MRTEIVLRTHKKTAASPILKATTHPASRLPWEALGGFPHFSAMKSTYRNTATVTYGHHWKGAHLSVGGDTGNCAGDQALGFLKRGGRGARGEISLMSGGLAPRASRFQLPWSANAPVLPPTCRCTHWNDSTNLRREIGRNVTWAAGTFLRWAGAFATGLLMATPGWSADARGDFCRIVPSHREPIPQTLSFIIENPGQQLRRGSQNVRSVRRPVRIGCPQGRRIPYSMKSYPQSAIMTHNSFQYRRSSAIRPYLGGVAGRIDWL